MSLKMKVGSYYYNKHTGVLRCAKYENGVYVVVNKNFMYDVDEYGKDRTLFPSRDCNLEYECDKYGNEVYAEESNLQNIKVNVDIDIDNTAVLLQHIKEGIQKMKKEMQEPEPWFEVGDKVIYENDGELQLGYVGGFLLGSYWVISSSQDYSQGVICKAEDVYDYESLPKYETQYGTVVVIDEEETDNYLCLVTGKDTEEYFTYLDKEWFDKYVTAIKGFSVVTNKNESRKHNHYFKDVSNLNEIDVYAVLTLFEVHDPCIAHAAKKLLCTGNRGHKDFETDVQDAIDSLVRWKELNKDLNK